MTIDREDAAVDLMKLAEKAVEYGFTRAGTAKIEKLKLSTAPEVRGLCAANACGQYGRTWVCPPAVGTVEECVLELNRHTDALVVQYVGVVEDSFDFEGSGRIHAEFNERFRSFRSFVNEALGGEALALGAGGCDLCGDCAYPDEPCRNPQDALRSVESYGINVLILCKRANLPYHSGKDTVTFTGAYIP